MSKKNQAAASSLTWGQRFRLKLKRMTAEDWLIAAFNYIFLAIIIFVCVVPFLYVISISFTATEAFGKYPISLIPKIFSVEDYAYLFSRGSVILRAYLVSIIVTVSGTVLSVVVMGGFAYPLSKKKLPGRKIILGYVLFSMLFGGGLIPTYLTVSKWLGMKNTLFALILPGCFNVWNMILMKNFFSSLPESIEEAALIDGANEIQTFFRIAIPLSKPIFATIALFMAVGYWSDWFSSLLYISDNTKYPIMMVLKQVLTTNSGISPGGRPPSYALKMAVVVVTVLPIMCIYPFLQKYFARGILMGSIKG